jgi:hypothetical protein
MDYSQIGLAVFFVIITILLTISTISHHLDVYYSGKLNYKLKKEKIEEEERAVREVENEKIRLEKEKIKLEKEKIDVEYEKIKLAERFLVKFLREKLNQSVVVPVEF